MRLLWIMAMSLSSVFTAAQLRGTSGLREQRRLKKKGGKKGTDSDDDTNYGPFHGTPEFPLFLDPAVVQQQPAVNSGPLANTPSPVAVSVVAQSQPPTPAPVNAHFTPSPFAFQYSDSIVPTESPISTEATSNPSPVPTQFPTKDGIASRPTVPPGQSLSTGQGPIFDGSEFIDPTAPTLPDVINNGGGVSGQGPDVCCGSDPIMIDSVSAPPNNSPGQSTISGQGSIPGSAPSAAPTYPDVVNSGVNISGQSTDPIMIDSATAPPTTYLGMISGQATTPASKTTTRPTVLPTKRPTQPTQMCPNEYSLILHSKIMEGDEIKFCESNSDCDNFFVNKQATCCYYPECVCGPPVTGIVGLGCIANHDLPISS